MTDRQTENSARIKSLWQRAAEAHARKSYPLAIRMTQGLLAWAPDSLDAWSALSRALEGAGRLNSARIAHARLRLVAPSDTTHRQRAIGIFFKLRMQAKAWHASRALVVLDPANARGWEYLARGRALLGRAGEVQRFLGPLACLRPNDPGVAVAWSRASMSTRDLDAAELWCREAISLARETPERLFDLARILRAKGDFEAAEAILDDVIAREPRFGLRARAVRLTVTDADFSRPADTTSK